jgi:hypothetical protein
MHTHNHKRSQQTICLGEIENVWISALTQLFATSSFSYTIKLEEFSLLNWRLSAFLMTVSQAKLCQLSALFDQLA